MRERLCEANAKTAPYIHEPDRKRIVYGNIFRTLSFLYLFPLRRSPTLQILRGTIYFISGEIPQWLRGTVVRNGPGIYSIGGVRYKHWFDGLALLQRFHFEDGKVIATSNCVRMLPPHIILANLQFFFKNLLSRNHKHRIISQC